MGQIRNVWFSNIWAKDHPALDSLWHADVLRADGSAGGDSKMSSKLCLYSFFSGLLKKIHFANLN